MREQVGRTSPVWKSGEAPRLRGAGGRLASACDPSGRAYRYVTFYAYYYEVFLMLHAEGAG
jgi:hypothetical protein